MRLSRYDPNWVHAFDQERARLAEALGPSARRIDHVGSTSVPGLQAKPVIDIQISVTRIDLPFFAPLLRALGDAHLPMDDPPVTTDPFFHRPARWPTTHHIHLCEEGGFEERAHLAFRNWLRLHPDDRDHYGALKDRLAAVVDATRMRSLIAYTEGKGPWVQAITLRALAAGLAD